MQTLRPRMANKLCMYFFPTKVSLTHLVENQRPTTTLSCRGHTPSKSQRVGLQPVGQVAAVDGDNEGPVRRTKPHNRPKKQQQKPDAMQSKGPFEV
jgi:hypothetical protein